MAKLKNDINPALAAHRAAKNKAIKKGKAEVQAQRHERLAKQNPERIQRQIDALKELKDARTHDKERLRELEMNLKAVLKAREALGQQGIRSSTLPRPKQNHDDGGTHTLGKRKRGDEGPQRYSSRQDSDGGGSSETDEDIRHIPWPSDRENEPPIANRHRQKQAEKASDEANDTTSPQANRAPPQTVYSGAAKIRDLHQDAINAFLPQARKKSTGPGDLSTANEAKKTAGAQGKLAGLDGASEAEKEAQHIIMASAAAVDRTAEDIDDDLSRLEQTIAQMEHEDVMIPGEGSAMQVERKAADEASKKPELGPEARKEGEVLPMLEQGQHERKTEWGLKHMFVEDVSDEDL